MFTLYEMWDNPDDTQDIEELCSRDDLSHVKKTACNHIGHNRLEWHYIGEGRLESKTECPSFVIQWRED